MLTADNVFLVKSYYDILNNGGVRSDYWHSILKCVAPLKVKVFAWHVVHDKVLSRSNLHRRGWSGPIHCDTCGFEIESTIHIFLHYLAPTTIWDFLLLNANSQLNNIQISEIFSLFHILKFNFDRSGWNTLVFVALWCFWLNWNNIVFKSHGRNISFIFHQFLHLISCWTDNLVTRLDAATMVQTIC